jgi:hypothetical protein
VFGAAVLVGGAAWMGIARVAAAAWSAAGTGKIGFHAKTNAATTIDGTSSDLRVSDDGTTVTFTVPIASLKTGIDLRDEHLHKYLGAPGQSNVTLTLVRGELKLPEDGKSVDGSIGTNLTINGVKKYEQVWYSLSRSGGTYYVKVPKLLVQLSNYKIEQPKFAGVKVNDQVSIEVEAKLEDRK